MCMQKWFKNNYHKILYAQLYASNDIHNLSTSKEAMVTWKVNKMKFYNEEAVGMQKITLHFIYSDLHESCFSVPSSAHVLLLQLFVRSDTRQIWTDMIFYTCLLFTFLI